VGRLAARRTRWHINDAGWNSTREYRPAAERDRLCVAVIGNSYVQGFHADVDSGLTATLDRQLGDAATVYNLGKSGVVMPQAVRVARYAAHHFDPEVLVLVMTQSSLRAALRNFGYRIHNTQYLYQDGELRELPPSRYEPRTWLRWPHHSAFARYLYLNAGVVRGFGAIRQQARQRNDPLAEQRHAQERPLMVAAAQEVIATLKAEHPRRQLLFVHDGDRRQMYETRAEPPPLRASRIWADVCREQEVPFLDLTAAFWADYREHRQPLDFPDDYHWNRRAMTIVAAEIAAWLQRHDALDASPDRS
jgi:hypothetical protein